MKTETLLEFEEKLKMGRALGVDESLALMSEVWRLKTALAGKNMGLGYWRDSCNQAKNDLERLADENRSLHEEMSRLAAAIALPRCELESRWSNCAVRRLKRVSDDGAVEEVGPKLLSWEP
jgi:hypothetical protein